VQTAWIVKYWSEGSEKVVCENSAVFPHYHATIYTDFNELWLQTEIYIKHSFDESMEM